MAGIITAVLLLAGCASAPTTAKRITDPNAVIVDAGATQQQIQAIFDAHRSAPATFAFARSKYIMTDPLGLRVPPGATLELGGAKFEWTTNITEDGQTFLVQNAPNVTFIGGAITGQRDAWDRGTNVAGIRVRGKSDNFKVTGLTCTNLSSNGIGVFGASDAAPIRNVSFQDVEIANCCNYYADYLEKDKGPAKGSVREDQGSVALYYVDGWSVRNCNFSESQSDGTHFFHAHHGQFLDTRVTGSKMGGYFLEGCNDVVAERCVMLNNGSRGVTIERDSKRCTLTLCTITNSGREGLWAPDVADVTVTQNSFRENGRKDDDAKDCEIRIDETNEYATVTANITVEGNKFTTNPHQTAAIYISEGVLNSRIRKNEFRGEIPEVMLTDTTRLHVKVDQ